MKIVVVTIFGTLVTWENFNRITLSGNKNMVLMTQWQKFINGCKSLCLTILEFYDILPSNWKQHKVLLFDIYLFRFLAV